MTTRAPRKRTTPRTKPLEAEVKAKLTAVSKAQVAKDIAKLDKQRAAAKKTLAKKPEERMTPAAARKAGTAALAKVNAERKSKHANEHSFKEGNKPKGVSDGSGGDVGAVKHHLTAHKLRLMATTGMTPLEFLTAVYRDQLYHEYDVEIVDAKRGHAQFFPRMDQVTGEIATTKVTLKIEQRIAAATSAAPYVHRKMPIGIDGGEGKPLTVVTADRLATLSDAELDKMMQVFGKLGIGAEFEDGAQRPYGIDDADLS